MAARSTLARCGSAFRHWSFPMKARALAAAIVLLLSASLALPTLAQDSTQSQSSTQSPVNSADQTQPAASTDQTTPPADSAATTTSATAPKETHDKGKNDV